MKLFNIPNLLTCCNLIAGCVGIVFVLTGESLTAGLIAMVIACMFDFLDGFTARLLKVSGPVGKELDSLADVVSFGVLPAMMVFQLSRLYMKSKGLLVSDDVDGCSDYIEANDLEAFLLCALAFLIPAFSALRLAKFNLDERQTSSFIGLPTPANALLWGGLVATYDIALMEAPYVYLLLLAVPLTCYLLVSEIPMFSLKFHDIKWTNNWYRYVFILGIVLLFSVLRLKALAWIIVWYIIWNAVYQIIRKKS
ncbi:MAG TPA: CDP-diacylglycerol--serine O-phosphatidyltransferase [Bacteroidales bacterium]|nr:CDP-diacylglycerol--serine O-phosphatidyltransferase [Bacteroidales bacterium]